MLCLCDPQDVISTAVKMSVRNKEQATNFAQVIKGPIQENRHNSRKESSLGCT